MYRLVVFAGLLLLACAPRRASVPALPAPRPPNVVLIITDDQGYGDLGSHGNPRIRTPHLDRLARDGASFGRFYASPVCSPTRASLLTGRHAYRTGVVDTYLGRSLMRPDEVTLAERLRQAGYRTGIFGKWHLGDNHPLRPQDQGFDETLVLRGGGIGQPSDPPGGDHYDDATLWHNGRPVKTRGYCSDVITGAAIDFVRRHREQPFFVYLAFNAPHTPLEAPPGHLAAYQAEGLSDTTARIYAMVTNIDDNVGRLLAALDEQGVARDTLVMFMSDNGAQQERYDSGLRGLKGSVFEGGVRVPFLFRWPARVKAGLKIGEVAAHLDVVPTVLAAAGQSATGLDGRDLLPLLVDRALPWPERTLFLQWHRGDEPVRGRSFAAITRRWKLAAPAQDKPGLLFDLLQDPAEANDLAARHPEVVKELTAAYDAWFTDVTSRGFDPPRIKLGTPHEDPVVLTRQDWRGPRAGWKPDDLGHWEVDVAAGAYDIRLIFPPSPEDREVRLALGAWEARQRVPAGTESVTVSAAKLAPAPARLEAELTDAAGKSRGVHYVEVARAGQ